MKKSLKDNIDLSKKSGFSKDSALKGSIDSEKSLDNKKMGGPGSLSGGPNSGYLQDVSV
jgi:hypothetical protein